MYCVYIYIHVVQIYVCIYSYVDIYACHKTLFKIINYNLKIKILLFYTLIEIDLVVIPHMGASSLCFLHSLPIMLEKQD